MDAKELLRRGIIRPFDAQKQEIMDLLDLARNDILVAKSLSEQSPDWAEIVAYNSMLQSGRALMFLRGYRPAGESHHLAVISFLEGELGDRDHEIVLCMASMRKKRSTAMYMRRGSVSMREVQIGIRCASQLHAYAAKQVIGA